MPKYTEHFHLEPGELDLIEQALRREIAAINKPVANKHVDGHSLKHDTAQARVRDLNDLLGKLFHQKKFYSHVNNTGVPAG